MAAKLLLYSSVLYLLEYLQLFQRTKMELQKCFRKKLTIQGKIFYLYKLVPRYCFKVIDTVNSKNTDIFKILCLQHQTFILRKIISERHFPKSQYSSNQWRNKIFI